MKNVDFNRSDACGRWLAAQPESSAACHRQQRGRRGVKYAGCQRIGWPAQHASRQSGRGRQGVEAAKLSTEQARKSLDEINKVLASMSISVQFQIDPNYKDVIVKVVDQESGKVVRQIPTVEVVRIAKAMDNLKGLLFAQTA